ncbi:hypothetical protein BGZ67_006350 [Mortierella alpina]|nr:hypothetical protein BGZ67_006350 [Mortierella alpina]
MSGRNNGNQGQADEGWRSIPDRDVWGSSGSKTNFMGSYGIKPTPEGFAEARDLMDAFKQNDWQDRQEKASSGNAGGTKGVDFTIFHTPVRQKVSMLDRVKRCIFAVYWK